MDNRGFEIAAVQEEQNGNEEKLRFKRPPEEEPKRLCREAERKPEKRPLTFAGRRRTVRLSERALGFLALLEARPGWKGFQSGGAGVALHLSGGVGPRRRAAALASTLQTVFVQGRSGGLRGRAGASRCRCEPRAHGLVEVRPVRLRLARPLRIWEAEQIG
ncbi:hypothetical protein EYF80_021844 [Liparis tanakae]|uniref:Uncharacterized protein n=1 Tax=Liparis tanakae TaxID=230148 RepID=A0A4Z2HRD9_9TELE|nr:hypothetical protein EYF80_021844 [Liparis tanakae]